LCITFFLHKLLLAIILELSANDLSVGIITVRLEYSVTNLAYSDKLFDFGTSQQIRFTRFGRMTDINSSISNLLQAVQLTDDGHKNKPVYLSNLGLSQRSRFQRLSELTDIDNSISNLLRAVVLTDDGNKNKPMYFSSLGFSQRCRFEHLGELTDINDSISSLLQANQLTDDGHEDKPMYLSNLGISQQIRFEYFGKLSDLDDSISNLLRVVQLTDDTHKEKPKYLSNLGTSQQSRFERLGEPTDIDNSISNLLRAVELTDDGHTNKPGYLSNLGTSQQSRFGRLGRLADINDSISNLLRALQLMDDEHPGILSNLGNSQRSRFERFGKLSDIDNSISNLLRAVQLTDDEHPDKPMHLSNLGAGQMRRFERLGSVSDIEASICSLLQAVHLTDDTHPNKPSYLLSLGMSQLCRFERLGSVSDVEASISSSLQAIQLIDDKHPNMPLHLSGLGTSQLSRFECLAEVSDSETAISNLLKAVQLTEDGHPNKPMYLSNLGLGWMDRFDRFAELSDIENSISSLLQAVQLTDDGHPDKPLYLSNLGRCQVCRFERLGELADFVAAVSNFRIAAQSKTAYPSHALSAARQWAEISRKNSDLLSAMEGYRTALQILPKVAWLGLEAISRHDWLLNERSEDLTCLAAACAIQLGNLEEAVQLLDFGRSVFWQQAALLRTDLELLREMKPELAKQFESIGRQLDAGNFSGLALNILEHNFGGDRRSSEDIGMERHRLVGLWEKSLDEIRQLPKFEHFLKPIPFNQLCQAVTVGQVVIINVSIDEIDALVFGATGSIQHVPLDHINLSSLTEMSDNIALKLPIHASASQQQKYTRRYLKPALRMIWDNVVTPIFDKIQIPLEGNIGLPEYRIWWYPTGPLTFLPIHAAGGGKGVDVSHIVISSYMTTLQSLFKAKKPAQHSLAEQKFLSISQHNTPNQSSLPRSMEEVEKVVQVLSSAGWSEKDIVSLNGLDATVDRVSAALDVCSWVHFACHGMQHPSLGMKSGFALQDGNLELGQIASKRLTTGQFAFLSVCHAASGHKDLPGEALHLAAGLQFAGFSSVIATMWGISDNDAPKVAAYTYEYLFRNGVEKLDYSEAATALNRAVLHLREDPRVTLDRWAPYIHFGT
jgi:hypothetical protein